MAGSNRRRLRSLRTPSSRSPSSSRAYPSTPASAVVSTRVAAASASLSRVRSSAASDTPSSSWSMSTPLARAPRPLGPASVLLAAVSALAIARQYSSPRPPMRTTRTSTSSPHPLCATEASRSSSPPFHSYAMTGNPLAAAASEKNPSPAPTSSRTPPTPLDDNDPTSASAEVGAFGSYRPACHPPHLVRLAPTTSTLPPDAFEPERWVSMSNGGSNAALTGYPARSFTFGMA